MLALSDLDLPGLQTQLRTWGHPPSHARRLLRAYYDSGGQLDPNSLELGRPLLSRFGRDLRPMQSHVAHIHESADGTRKLLVRFADGSSAESVLMLSHRPEIAAGCISSQIGCAMGCDFCASTRAGLLRNLSAGEIVEQFLHLRYAALSLQRRLGTLVFMGMGEPMHNLPAVLAAIARISDPALGSVGPRSITISTVGIIPGIHALTRARPGVQLAISLHAPDDQIRAGIVPSARRYPIRDILAAAEQYQAISGRITNIEYCLLAGINDADEHARQLAALLRGLRFHVNLIPYNPIGAGISGQLYHKPTDQRVQSFLRILKDNATVAHVRHPRGDDVSAACGQLQSHSPAPAPLP